MDSKETHYQTKPVYGMGHTRRDRIIELVDPKPGMRVLDVGCARGSLGKLIKEKGAYVAGIELSKAAADEARHVLDAVFVADIEQNLPDELTREPFDVIVLAELVEHVFDPVNLLRAVKPLLKDGGSIVITTPNFMTWTNRLRFLIGDFKYQEQGMFDFGHIRWFTYRYLKEVLAESDFSITKEKHIIFPGKLTALLKNWPSLFAFQFIVKVKRND